MVSTPLATVRPEVFLAPLGVWLLLAVLAVANGVFRETMLVPRMDEYRAHVLSTALLVLLILSVSYAFFAWSDRAFTDAELLAIGAGWTILTVGFEFLVGYAEGTPVSVTIGQYDVTAGQVWIVVPITLLVAPYLWGSILRV
ncbi:hypothetical protein GCM10028857_27640 [Salinarchaeum chitinilyticum]